MTMKPSLKTLTLGLAALVRHAASQGSWDAALYMLPEATWTKFQARCLDGSPAGYYFRNASTVSGGTKLKIHIQGGGWCQSMEDCYARSLTKSGSTKTWAPWLSLQGDAFYGLMDGNSTSVNPFGDWNFLWVPYCDGSSETSNREGPVPYNGTNLYFRGAAIVDAVFFEMERLHGLLTSATEVIVSGTSAGGMATFLSAGYIKSLLKNPSARVVAVPDAGFWLDHSFYNHPGQPSPWYEALTVAMGPQLWNSSLRGSAAACLQDYGPKGEGAKCFFPQHLYPYLTDIDGVFILQSQFDPANLFYSYGMTCNLAAGSCSAAEVDAIQAYHLDLQTNITSSIASNGFTARDGYFLTSCYQHEESCRPPDWYGITIGGQTPNATFYDWYVNGARSPGSRRIDAPWPSDGSCVAQGYKHGSC